MRLIDTGENDAFFNMALDEAIFHFVKEGHSPETFRFFTFNPVAITFGRLQHADDINFENCKKYGIDVVRRPTGGRAVFHCGDLTYSFMIRESNPLLGGNPLQTFEKLSLAFAEGFKLLGISCELSRGTLKYKGLRACFGAPSRYELTIKGKKILGSAQYREKGFILQQGVIPVIKPQLPIHLVIKDGIQPSIEEITGKKFKIEELKKALIKGMEKRGFKFEVAQPESYEMELAEKLKEKYKSHDWMFLR